MPDFETVANVADVPPGGRVSIVVDGRAALLLRIGEDFYAVEDICSHDGQPLTDGPVQGASIECPRHGAKFDVRTGRPLCMPAVEPIAVFEVRVQSGQVQVRAP